MAESLSFNDPAVDKQIELEFNSAAFIHHNMSAVAHVIYDQDAASIGGNVAAAVLIYFCLRSSLLEGVFLHLAFVWAAWSTFMYFFSRKFFQIRESLSSNQLRIWINAHRALESGLCINFSAGIYIVAISGVPDGLWIATLAGALYTCAEALTVSWDFGSFLCTVPVIVLTMVRIQMLGGSVYIICGLFVFLIFAAFSIFELQGGFARSIRLSFLNLELAKRLKAEKIQAELDKKLAEEANDAKSRFFASANHDLRQPLHALALNIFNLSNSLTSNVQRTSLRDAQVALSTLNTLFSQLMEVSRLDSGIESVKMSTFQLQPLLDTLREEFLPLFKDKNVRLIVNDTKSQITSDYLMVERIIRNLLGNALKFTLEGGVIVAARPLGAYIRLQFWDTGIGINEADMPKIFEEFHQINPEETMRGQAQGLGLGLSIVKRLANQLRCPINVLSQPGKGSRFEIILPRADDAEFATERGTCVDQYCGDEFAQFLDGIPIAVLEDDALGLIALSNTLEAWGAKVYPYNNIASFNQSLERCTTTPAIMILDYQIGTANISELIAHIKRIHGPSNLIVTSGVQSVDLKDKLRQMDIVFLSKPIDPIALRNALANAPKRMFG